MFQDSSWTESRDTHNILSESEFRDFWISWKDNRIAMGKGLIVGQDEQISKSDSLNGYHVHAVSFSAMAGVTAEFELPDDPGKLKLWIITT